MDSFPLRSFIQNIFPKTLFSAGPGRHAGDPQTGKPQACLGDPWGPGEKTRVGTGGFQRGVTETKTGGGTVEEGGRRARPARLGGTHCALFPPSFIPQILPEHLRVQRRGARTKRPHPDGVPTPLVAGIIDRWRALNST